MNAEFQKIARRDKKVLSEQCKEIEESNRMIKTSHSKKIGDTKGTKMGTIKDRNHKKSNKQKILRRGSKNTQRNYTERC